MRHARCVTFLGARVRKATVDVAIGLVGVSMLAFAVSSWITTSLTGEPGSMSTGFGSFSAGVLALLSIALLGWAGVRIRRQDVGARRRSLVLVGVAASLMALIFGAVAVEVVTEHRAEQRALAAAAPVRDIEGELADAYWAWERDQGGRQAVYTGDETEWWSLDPDGDGRRDQDAPVLRVLRDSGSTARRVSMFDSDSDLIVDQLQWTAPSPTGAVTVWCAPVDRHPAGILGVRWHRARPRACDAPASSQVSAGS